MIEWLTPPLPRVGIDAAIFNIALDNIQRTLAF